MIVTPSQMSLGLIATGALIVVVYWHNRDDAFDLRWLLVDSKTGKVSLFKVGQLVALAVSTWAFVVLVQRDKLTEWFFCGYMAAWAGANLLSKWLATKEPQK